MIVYYPALKIASPSYHDLQGRLDATITLITGADIPPAYDVLVEGKPTREQITASANLRLVIIPFAGMVPPTRILMQEFPHIAVHNLHHNAVITAETMLALLLSAAKFVVPIDRDFRHGDWRFRYDEENPSVVLEGKTVLVIGYGAIGQKVARMCKGFAMHVVAVRRHAEQIQDEIADEIHPITNLNVLLPRANVLMLCVPLTEDTEGLIGSHELALLPSNAILVNGGRGALVDEQAFYEALQSGQLYAAGSDVWYRYPTDETSSHTTLPATYPFHELDNIVMSPHRGGGSLETEARRITALADLLNRATQHEPLPNRVDVTRGY